VDRAHGDLKSWSEEWWNGEVACMVWIIRSPDEQRRPLVSLRRFLKNHRRRPQLFLVFGRVGVNCSEMTSVVPA
ncbi:MAG: hypothetical protein AAF989_10980, partial [Planctomycetota bacterium]